MTPIITPQELINLVKEKEIILVDARSGADAKEKYSALHLKNALHFNLEYYLAKKTTNPSLGGRHPLPSINTFAETLTISGITNNSHIIIYDDKNASNAAARCWWMLKAIGHEKVQVLDGGFQQAIAAGFPADANKVIPKHSASYKINNWQLPTANIDEVEKAAQDKNYLVIDVRDTERYKGNTEPIDLIAGHIPGAINIPFKTNLDENGFYLSKEKLREKYEEAIGNRGSDAVIVHCGSGVTACHTLLAMDYAGIEIPKLYVGSWSEWSRSNKPIAKEK